MSLMFELKLLSDMKTKQNNVSASLQRQRYNSNAKMSVLTQVYIYNNFLYGKQPDASGNECDFCESISRPSTPLECAQWRGVLPRGSVLRTKGNIPEEDLQIQPISHPNISA